MRNIRLKNVFIPAIMLIVCLTRNVKMLKSLILFGTIYVCMVGFDILLTITHEQRLSFPHIVVKCLEWCVKIIAFRYT